MPKKRTYSRLNVRYLTSRYAGVLFLLASLGALVGTAVRTLVLPTRYSAEAHIGVTVDPESAAPGMDWDGLARAWRASFDTPAGRGLLAVNLRHALKLAVTADVSLDTAGLGAQLASFDPPASYSASLLPGGLAGRFGPVLRIGARDLVRFLDFQSLAVVAADLVPPHDVPGWDFAAFRRDGPHADGLIVQPGPGDRYFQVFYLLHRLLRGSEAATPRAAWQTTVDEVTARLLRETGFAGGGGFGHQAKRELLREIAAIPVLAANGLYHASGWLVPDAAAAPHDASWAARGDDVALSLTPAGDGATVRAAAGQWLHPLAYPRDTAVTRLAPMTVATVLATIAARQDQPGHPPPQQAAPAPASAAPVPAAPRPAARHDPEPEAADPEPEYREVIDDIANQQRLAHIDMVEEALRLTRVEREAALRRLHTGRENENRLSYEAVNARNRADRLRARYDEAVAAAEDDAAEPHVPADTAALFAKRDALLRRLTGLLEYCTEEHPFVREARRELAALDVILATHTPDEARARGAEARATRLATLYLEWEAAVEQADSLEERARRQAEAVSCLLDEVTSIERCVSDREVELVKAKAAPVPILRIEVAAQRPRPAPAAAPEPEPEPEPEVVPEPEPVAVAVADGPRLVFSPVPPVIDLRRDAPSWLPVLWGCLGGVAAALVWAALRETFGQRFLNAGEAHRLIKLPVLASLPAYDPASVRKAAAAMKGESVRSKSGYRFVPIPVETAEPPPLAKRPPIRPAKKRRFLGRWILGAVCLLLAGLLYHVAADGLFQPVPADAELPLPAAVHSVRAEEAEASEWGDLP